MKRSKMWVFTAVMAAIALTSGGASAEGPQFRETVTVKGTLNGAADDHHLTFSGPVSLPGVSLGAGTYIFRRPAANVLQVLSANRRPYKMVTTVPAARSTPSDRYEIVLGASAAPGAPRRIDAWFVPGESTGQQLIYPTR